MLALEALPHLIWALSALVGLVLLRSVAIAHFRRLDAQTQAPEWGSRLERLEERVNQLDLRTRPTPKLR